MWKLRKIPCVRTVQDFPFWIRVRRNSCGFCRLVRGFRQVTGLFNAFMDSTWNYLERTHFFNETEWEKRFIKAGSILNFSHYLYRGSETRCFGCITKKRKKLRISSCKKLSSFRFYFSRVMTSSIIVFSGASFFWRLNKDLSEQIDRQCIIFP